MIRFSKNYWCHTYACSALHVADWLQSAVHSLSGGPNATHRKTPLYPLPSLCFILFTCITFWKLKQGSEIPGLYQLHIIYISKCSLACVPLTAFQTRQITETDTLMTWVCGAVFLFAHREEKRLRLLIWLKNRDKTCCFYIFKSCRCDRENGSWSPKPAWTCNIWYGLLS